MRIPWIIAAFSTPQVPQEYVLSPHSLSSDALAVRSTHILQRGASMWLSSSSLTTASSSTEVSSPPTKEDILVLRQAFAEFYGLDRNLEKSEQLLSDAIARWQNQPPDELAGLYRVRGDCYMLLADAARAASDYDIAVSLLQGPGGDKADPSELPAALLGRARAVRSQSGISQSQAAKSADDYKLALKLSSREEWDTEQELIEDGAARNPYAAWEWGSMLRKSGQVAPAANAHLLASQAFDEVGDKARSVMSLIDAGIDLAATDQLREAESLLEKAVQKTTGVESRDTSLLQRVIAKEGEGRIALAATLWNDDNRVKAEQVLGEACIRLDQLQADATRRATVTEDGSGTAKTLAYSIDDSIQPLEFSCARFKNEAFLKDKLSWPEILQMKVKNLQSLR